jgi:hypothetical protein
VGYFDTEKAFDCVSHEVLLRKLKYYGIKDKQYNLYKSYLQDKFQRTSISNGPNNHKMYSEWGSAGTIVVHNVYK